MKIVGDLAFEREGFSQQGWGADSFDNPKRSSFLERKLAGTEGGTRNEVSLCTHTALRETPRGCQRQISKHA